MPRSRPCAELAQRIRRALADETGNAALEFLGAGVVLLVPIVYLVVALSVVQSAAFAVEGAARQAARVYATADSDAAGQADLEAAVAVTLADYGVSASPRVEVTCAPRPADCLMRDGSITVTVGATVPLPLAPAAFGAGPLAVPVQASATQPVSRFRPAVEP